MGQTVEPQFYSGDLVLVPHLGGAIGVVKFSTMGSDDQGFTHTYYVRFSRPVPSPGMPNAPKGEHIVQHGFDGDHLLPATDDDLRKVVTKDPEFLKTEIFRKYASPELKREFPEAGTDFGFFGTQRTNESTRRILSHGQFVYEAEKALGPREIDGPVTVDTDRRVAAHYFDGPHVNVQEEVKSLLVLPPYNVPAEQAEDFSNTMFTQGGKASVAIREIVDRNSRRGKSAKECAREILSSQYRRVLANRSQEKDPVNESGPTPPNLQVGDQLIVKDRPEAGGHSLQRRIPPGYFGYAFFEESGSSSVDRLTIVHPEPVYKGRRHSRPTNESAETPKISGRGAWSVLLDVLDEIGAKFVDSKHTICPPGFLIRVRTHAIRRETLLVALAHRTSLTTTHTTVITSQENEVVIYAGVRSGRFEYGIHRGDEFIPTGSFETRPSDLMTQFPSRSCTEEVCKEIHATSLPRLTRLDPAARAMRALPIEGGETLSPDDTRVTRTVPVNSLPEGHRDEDSAADWLEESLPSPVTREFYPYTLIHGDKVTLGLRARPWSNQKRGLRDALKGLNGKQ